MMRNWKLPLAAVLVLGLAAFAYQRFDVAGAVDEAISVAPGAHANSAATGTAVDLARYSGALMFVQTGVADNSAYTVYVVLQDSGITASQTWANVDSVALDSVDNAVKELGYQGARRYVRAVERASGNAADTLFSAASFIMGGRRSR